MSRSATQMPTAGSTGVAAVIVLCFGPRSVTRTMSKALRRLCEYDTPVFMVPAVANGGVSSGSEGISKALESCPLGPVLFVHDDVALERNSLQRLVNAHLEGAMVAVPMSNDRGTDHFFGALPPVVSAGQDLRRHALNTPVSTRPAAKIRPGCLVTDVWTLGQLANKRIHDPFTLLSDQGLGFVVVDGAFAAHDASCGKPVRAIGVDTGQPVLVASMIVKNEQAMLAECLACLEGVVDRVEVVDTGSTDDTVSIAEASGAHVSHMDWCDDFSAARNVAADKCRDAMFTLWIDADERLVSSDVSLVRDLLRASHGEIEALDISISNFRGGASGEISSKFSARRIVRSDLLEFSGRIHEAPVRRGDPATALEATFFELLSIDHLGYSDDIIDDRDKRVRNLDLARAQHDETRSAKTSLDLARSLMLSGDSTAEAIDLLREAISSAGETRAETSAYLLGSLAHLLMERSEVEEAYTHALDAYRFLPTDDLAAAVFGLSALAGGKAVELVAEADSASGFVGAQPVFASPSNRRIFEVSRVKALATVGRGGDAWRAIEEWSGSGRVFEEQDWDAVGLVATTQFSGMDLLEPLVILVATQPSAVGLVPSLARDIAPELTALLSIAVVSTGAHAPDAVLTGALAAMVVKRWDLFDELVPHADVLDVDLRRKLAVRLDEKGQHARADAVLGETSRSAFAAFGGRSE